MKAIRIHKHGDVDVLSVDDIPEPVPAPGEVKIRIKATSLNHMDIWVRNGIPGVAALPLTLGCDGSGEIAAVGAGVFDFAVGEKVFVFPLKGCGSCLACAAQKENLCRKFQIFGEHRQGLHAEFVCVPKNNVIRMAEALDFEQAAAFPLTFLTAWHMLVTLGSVDSSMTVLVVGAASGIGSAAVQIAKHFGAKVIATAGSTEKLQQARSLGADFVIHHYEESVSRCVKEITSGAGVELVFEHVGEKLWSDCLKSLAWGGKLITCGATSGPQVSFDLRHIFIKQQQIIGSTMGTKQEMIALQDLLAQGKLKPIISKIFPYFEIKAAHEYLEQAQQFGKVVLKW